MGFHRSPLVALLLGHKQWEAGSLNFTDEAEKAYQDDYTIG